MFFQLIRFLLEFQLKFTKSSAVTVPNGSSIYTPKAPSLYQTKITMVSINLLRLSARQHICNRPIRLFTSTNRRFSQTPLSRFPKKGSEDKDSINAEPSEYSKSGTDEQAAQKDSAAYNPSTTDPEKEKDLAGVVDEVLSIFAADEGTCVSSFRKV